MENNHNETTKDHEHMEKKQTHLQGKRTNTKSLNNVKELVPSHHKRHAKTYSKRNGKEYERLPHPVPTMVEGLSS